MKFLNNPDNENTQMLKVLQALHSALNVSRIMDKARNELNDHDYDFFVNSSMDTIKRFVFLHIEYLTLLEEDDRKAEEVKEQLAQQTRQYLDAFEAETIGNRINEDVAASPPKKRRNNKNIPTVIDGDNDDNVVDEDIENQDA